MDTNNYNYQDLGQQGITLGQASDTVLQDTAGFGGTTDANGFFGTTTNTNDIFGQTFKTNTETGEFNTTQTNTDDNTLLGATNTFQGNTTFGATDTNTYAQPVVTPIENNTIIGIDDTNALFSNPTLIETKFLPPTTTKTTTTTTNTTYGISASQPQIIGQNTLGTVDTNNHYQSEYLATGNTKYDTTVFPDAPVGYGTTAADFATVNQAQTTTTDLETTTQTQTTYDVNPSTYVDYNTTNIPTTYENSVVETTSQPEQVITTQIPEIQNQVIESTSLYTITPQENIIQTPPPQMIQTQFGRRIIDEDFRRGRPIYNDDFREFKLRQNSNNNNNLPIRPSYNVGLYTHPHLFNYGYGGGGFGYNKLDKLTRGSSYDVKVNSNLPKTSNNIKDFL